MLRKSGRKHVRKSGRKHVRKSGRKHMRKSGRKHGFGKESGHGFGTRNSQSFGKFARKSDNLYYFLIMHLPNAVLRNYFGLTQHQLDYARCYLTNVHTGAIGGPHRDFARYNDATISNIMHRMRNIRQGDHCYVRNSFGKRKSKKHSQSFGTRNSQSFGTRNSQSFGRFSKKRNYVYYFLIMNLPDSFLMKRLGLNSAELKFVRNHLQKVYSYKHYDDIDIPEFVRNTSSNNYNKRLMTRAARDYDNEFMMPFPEVTMTSVDLLGMPTSYDIV